MKKINISNLGLKRKIDSSCKYILLIFLTLVLPFGTSAHSAVWFVAGDVTSSGGGTSWGDAFKTIQEAIDNPSTANEDEIWVKADTYNLILSTDVIDVNKAVKIYGGFAGGESSLSARDWETNETIVDGNNAVNHCFIITADATIDGFTITRGGSFGPSNSGGGIYIQESSATIANSRFTANSAYSGGGLGSWNDSTSPLTNLTITNCIFSLNEVATNGGGASIRGKTIATVTGCAFENNNGHDGGGIYSDSPSLAIIGTTFSTNLAGAHGGGIYLYYCPLVTVSGCAFSTNAAAIDGGAIYSLVSLPNIIGCIFYSNSGGEGGAIFSVQSNPTVTNSTFQLNSAAETGGAIQNLNSISKITNCTFYKNAAGTEGGAIREDHSMDTITNCILWGNDAPANSEISAFNAVDFTVTYCDILGGYVGVGNIGADIDDNPLFMDAENGDFHLTAGSPCIDAGNNSAIAGVATDFDGEIRIVDGDNNGSDIVDMGAYEFQSTGADITPPVITLLGNNPLVLEIGTPYSEPGATATDDVDGDISADIVIDSSAVDASALGSYTTTYNVSDSAGNPAIPVERIVNVGDSISPTTSGHAPVDNQPNVAVNSDIVVHILDSGSGVDSDSIVMTVTEDGVAVSGSVDASGTPAPSDYTVTFDPDSPFGNLASIEVTVSASDLAGNPMTDTYGFLTADVGGSTWDAADDDGDGIPNSEEDLLGTSATTRTIFIRPKKWDVALDAWVYWSDFVEVLFPPFPVRAGFADIFAFTDAGIEVVVIGAETDYLPMRDFDYDPGDPLKNVDLTLDPSGTPIDFDPDIASDPATVGWQGPHCDILEVEYYSSESGEYCTAVGGCNKNFGHVYFNDDQDEYRWDTKGFTRNTVEHHNYYKPAIYGFAQQNYFEEAWFAQLEKGQAPEYLIADPWPADYLCNWSADEVENDCYDFKPTYSSPLNLNKISPSSGSPDDWVEFKPITFDADKNIDCFDDDCTLTEPLTVNETQFDFNAVLRRTTMHELGHALLLAIPADHCGNDECILQVGVEDWTLHPFGTTCGHKAEIQGAVHNSRH